MESNEGQKPKLGPGRAKVRAAIKQERKELAKDNRRKFEKQGVKK